MREQSLVELRKGMSICNTHPRKKYKQINWENLLEISKIFFLPELNKFNCSQGELVFGPWTYAQQYRLLFTL